MLSKKNGIFKRVDIKISNESFETLCDGALKVLKTFKDWSLEDIKFELFKDGITNHLIKCCLRSDPENAVLVRVYGEKTELFIDRALEVRNMKMMNEAGLSEPLYCAFTNGLCYGYSPGQVLDRKMIRDPLISRLIAQKLANMHSIKSCINGVIPQPSLFPVFQKYLKLIPQSFPDPVKDERYKSLVPSKEILAEEVNLLEKHLIELESPTVFSHNDLLIKNIIYNEEKEDVIFIDFEYADFNYQALDIGNHFCEFAGVDTYEPDLYPDRDFQLKWLRQYLEAWYSVNRWDAENLTNDDVELLYVQVNKFSLAAHLFWGFWALIQSAHSTLDFDFLGYAVERIDEYFRRKKEFLFLELPNP